MADPTGWEWVPAAVTTVGTLTGVLIGGLLSRGNQRREKVADLRRSAYGAILSELSMVENRLDRANELIAEDSGRYFNDVVSKDNLVFNEHMQGARKRFTDDYLSLSDAFIARFEKMDSALAYAPDLLPDEEHEIFDKVIREARRNLLALARSEVSKRGRV